ncbi:MAG: right-handed parallel beta-helix repeat-containing protein [Candidatus Coatesbacteria bacterium]|nr:right-handed parallel beta-helix repeat-containing protein [Candidatus Coatesbacteria bacterium]
MNNRRMILPIIVCALASIIFHGVSSAQQEYWVDADDGHDGLMHTGSDTDPWLTITHALGRTGGSSGNPLIIHVRAASNAYDTTLGESFPLQPGSYTTLLGEGASGTIIDADTSEASAIRIASQLNVSIEGLTVRNGEPIGMGVGAGLMCSSSSYITIKDCVVTLNDGNKGGGIYFGDCDYATVESCDITDNNTGGFGAGISCSGSSPVIRSCTIAGNAVSAGFSGLGGGIWLESDSYPIIDECVINGNKAREGAGIGSSECASGGSSIEIIDSDIIGNIAYKSGGAGARLEDSNVRFIGGSIKDNVDANYGAGAYLEAINHDCSVTFEGVVISGNKTHEYDSYYGGGIYASGGRLSVSLADCEIENNTALHSGGGICAEYAKLNIESSVFSINKSNESGAGIYYNSNYTYRIEPDDAKFSHCVFSGNECSGNYAYPGGAALYLYHYISPSIFNCLIVGNKLGNSAEGGGVYLWDQSSPELVNCTIADNESDGLYADSSSCKPTLTNCILCNNDDDIENIACSYISHCDIGDGDCEGSDGNIQADPLFVPRDPDDIDVYTGYYLAQVDTQAEDSLCLNAGDDQSTAYDLDGYTTCTDGRYDEGIVDMGYHYPEGYGGDDDTYIELISFDAKARDGIIQITWETGTEIDCAGFDLLKAEADRTTPKKINDRLIPAKGSPAGGASYRFVDADVRPGITYSYYLIDIETAGRETRHGPVEAVVIDKNMLIDDGGSRRPAVIDDLFRSHISSILSHIYLYL